MSEYRRKTVQDYVPPTDQEISRYMDFSGIEKGLITPLSGAELSASYLTKGIIALSIAGIAFIFSINYFMNDVPEKQPVVDISKIALQFSKISNPSIAINYPDEIAFIEFPLAENSTSQRKLQKPKRSNTTKKETDKTSQVLITNRFIDAKPLIGIDSLYAYLRESLIYPLAPPADTIEGVVEIYFTVNKKGEIIKPTVTTSLGELFDAEAIRVIKSMPKWNPAKVNETPLTTKKQIAIQFKKQN